MNLLSQLRATLAEHQLVARGDSVVVGVSGGPDSLALLHALKTLAPDSDLHLHVAHLNHQLRGAESDADEAFVLALCRAWELPAASARWDVNAYAQEQHLSIEEAARILRYQFLIGVSQRVNAQSVAVAHNADDQVETVLLHFLRGAGLAGLRGMLHRSELGFAPQAQTDTHEHRRPLWLIRPLLDVPRADIEAYCAEHSLQPRLDQTNLDTSILRNRLRHELIPYLETINPNLREVVQSSARAIADDYGYIQQNVLGIFDRMTRREEGAFIFDRKWFRALPINLQRGVLREAAGRLGRIKQIGFTHLENARRVAADKGAGAQATFPQGMFLRVGYGDFTMGIHQPLPTAPLLWQRVAIALPHDGKVLLPESDWAVRVSMPTNMGTTDGTRHDGKSWRLDLDADRVRGQLVLRTRLRGEKFAPAGMGGKHKSLHEFMIDQKIPRHLRDLTPILADDEKALWVCGYRADERARATDTTKNVLRVEFLKEL